MNIKKDKATFLTIHRRIILVFILSSVFAILLVGSALNYTLKKTSLDNWKKKQEFVTLEFAPQCDFEIDEIKRNLEFLSKMPAFSDLPYIDQIDLSVNGIPENIDVEKRNILRELMALDKRFSTIFILRPNGDLYLICPFKRQLKVKRYNYADRAYFKEAARTKRPFISDSFISGAGIPVVVVVVPVLDKAGAVTSYIGGAVYLTNLSRLVSKERIGYFDFGFIVDRKGHLIAHTDTKLVKGEFHQSYIEHSLVSRFLDKGRGDDSKVMIEDSVDPVDGKQYLTSFVKLKSGWGLGLAQSREVILSEIRPVIWEITLLVSIIILVVSVTGVLFVRWIGNRWATTEQALWKRTYDLGERVKELNGLYGISKLTDNPDISLDEILQGVVELIPPSWQYPEITCSRILLNEKEYKTKNFKETGWKQGNDVIVHDKRVGSLEVHYLKERPEMDEGPFLKEERNLINEICDRLGMIIERIQFEEQIKASLEEKEILLREVHHRVKNNMQVVISLLRLQSEKTNEKQYVDMLKESQDRIKSMALIHEKLYQSKDFANIDFDGYVKALVNGLFVSHGVNPDKVALIIETKGLSLGLDYAIPCGLIINELVSNSLKYAFLKERAGEIRIVFQKTGENEVGLTVSDNGIGIPEKVDFEATETLGLDLVKILAKHQLGGKIELHRAGGTSFSIRFTVKTDKARI